MSAQSYRDAGVDIGQGEEAVRRLKRHVETTFTDRVLRGVGSFAGAWDASELTQARAPTLLFTIDGVGTKTLIAAALDRWEGIGQDIVHHSANDLVCQGAAPLVFLDYIASGSLNPSIIERIVAGASEACKDLSCVLIGGETAEMPQVYHTGAHDVVGTMIGWVDRERMITGESIEEGDILIALRSNGLHTNGYSLARKVLLHDAEMNLRENIPALGCPLGEALLTPHTNYSHLVRKLHADIGLKGVAHITGGGIPGNLPRILPKGLGARIERTVIEILPIFQLIQEKGNISDAAMHEAFNMGVGMILAVEAAKEKEIVKMAQGSYTIGKVVKGSGVAFT